MVYYGVSFSMSIIMIIIIMIIMALNTGLLDYKKSYQLVHKKINYYNYNNRKIVQQ